MRLVSLVLNSLRRLIAPKPAPEPETAEHIPPLPSYPQVEIDIQSLHKAFYSGETRGKIWIQDNISSLEIWRSAAAAGVQDAEILVGLCYAYGIGVPSDYSIAVSCYRRSAEKGQALGQNFLGSMYEYGWGVPRDQFRALSWYRKAAEQGDAMGQSNLGLMYEQGQGTDQDYEQAVYWFRKSAEQGYAAGQFNLGGMYYGGRGVVRDYSLAIEWCRKAANQDLEAAQKMLDRLEPNYYVAQLRYVPVLQKPQKIRAPREARASSKSRRK